MKKGQYNNVLKGSVFYKKILGILFTVAHDQEISSVELDVMSEHMALDPNIRFTHKGCQQVYIKTKRSPNAQKNAFTYLEGKRVLIKKSNTPLAYEPVPKFNINPEDMNLNITLRYAEN